MLITKKEDKLNALIGLIHEKGVARVIAIEERDANVSKSVTMELCFKEEGRKTKNYNKEKTPRWLFCTFKNRKRKYMKGKIYLKQKLLRDSFEVKRYGKRLLVEIKEEEMYKILIDRAFTKDEDNN